MLLRAHPWSPQRSTWHIDLVAKLCGLSHMTEETKNDEPNILLARLVLCSLRKRDFLQHVGTPSPRFPGGRLVHPGPAEGFLGLAFLGNNVHDMSHRF